MRKCPKCAADSKVLRTQEISRTIKRWRGCLACDHRWTTIEASVDAHYLVKQLQGLIEQLSKEIGHEQLSKEIGHEQLSKEIGHEICR